MSKYQLLHPLRREEYAALRADIAARGVLIPIEVDAETDEILDGHHRAEIAGALKVDCPRIVRRFSTEQAKREHVIKINLARRHLDPVRWGQAFALLIEERGARRGSGPQARETATIAALAEEVGVPERTARHRLALADAVEALPAPQRQAVLDGALSLTEAQRVERRDTVAQRVADLPTGQFRVIYADPPWAYSDRQGGGIEGHYGPAERHYPSMTLAELRALPIAERAAESAVLFLWATSPLLPEALALADAWGFTYKASFVWDKGKHNWGHYNSVRHEFLLLCTRGSCLPDVPTLIPSVQAIERTKTHSEKPEAFRRIIDTLYPHGRRLELFQRRPAEGWIGYGASAD